MILLVRLKLIWRIDFIVGIDLCVDYKRVMLCKLKFKFGRGVICKGF